MHLRFKSLDPYNPSPLRDGGHTGDAETELRGMIRRFTQYPTAFVGARDIIKISPSGRPGKLPRECHMGCDESAVGRYYPAGRLPVPLVDLVGGRCDWSHYLYSVGSDLVRETSRILTRQTSLPAAVSGLHAGCHIFYLHKRVGTRSN